MNEQPNSFHSLIVDTFNESELRLLCLELNIDYEELPAILPKSGKVARLIFYCRVNGRLPDLLVYCQKERTHYVWPSLADLMRQSEKQLLGQPQKPPQPFEPETVWIPAGTFLMGSLPSEGTPDNELIQHEVILPDYHIGRYPITNRQYAEFLKQTKHKRPPRWLGIKPPEGQETHPIVNVSWHDAQAYCAWLRDVTERAYRLPTEAEWEKAARGDDGRIYPWGNHWYPENCHHSAKGTVSIEQNPEGASPYGCQHMVGNIRQWTITLWGNDFETATYRYPYDKEDGREAEDADQAIYRIVRGSNFKDPPERHRCTARSFYAPDNQASHRGFRIVIAPGTIQA